MNLQMMGGIAALVHTAALMAGLVLSFTLMAPLLDAAPAQAQPFLSAHPALVVLWKLVAEWGAVLPFVIMLLALYERLKAGSPGWMRFSVFFGLLWAALTILTSDLNLRNYAVVANLHGSLAAQAAAWTVLARALWVLLLGLAALHTAGFPRSPAYLGVFLGAVGILTLNPAIAEPMFMIFGPGMMLWSAWVGLTMLRTPLHPKCGDLPRWQRKSPNDSLFFGD
jgi:hypothetical protein